MAARRRKRGGLYVTIIAAVLVAVLGYFVLQRLQQRGLIARSFASLAAASSMKTKAQIEIHLPPRLRGAERPFTEVRARLAGEVQYAESGTPELAGALYAEARGRGTIFFADGDVRVLEDDVRFRLDNIPVFLHRSGALVNRWTRVPAALLATRNPSEVRAGLRSAFSGLRRSGRDKVEGESLVRFSGQLSEDEEAALQGVMAADVSGNAGWNVFARLLGATNVASFDVWVEPKREEVRRVRVNFVRPLKDGGVFDFATVTLSFSDYGKAVSIDEPETRLMVEPRVFASLFGKGEVEETE